MSAKDWPRLIITLAILAAFLGALMFRYSPGLEETLKAIVLLAVGYWLGSSKGSSDKATQIEEMTVARSAPFEQMHVEAEKVEVDADISSR